MRKSTLLNLLSFGISSLLLLNSCKDDSFLATAPPVPDQSFTQEFDTLANAQAKGWVLRNRSVPVGINLNQGGLFTQNIYGQWNQPQTLLDYPIVAPVSAFKSDLQFFPAYSSRGTMFGYLFASYFSTWNPTGATGTGMISDWVISPVVTMQDGDKITFYSRAAINADDVDYTDRMQVRINTTDDGVNCGLGADVGNFSTVLLDVNPFYAERPDANGYPDNWTKFVATVSGLNGKAVKGRFAFRYFVEGGGVNNTERGFGIGLDKVTYTSVGH